MAERHRNTTPPTFGDIVWNLLVIIALLWLLFGCAHVALECLRNRAAAAGAREDCMRPRARSGASGRLPPTSRVSRHHRDCAVIPEPRHIHLCSIAAPGPFIPIQSSALGSHS